MTEREQPQRRVPPGREIIASMEAIIIDARREADELARTHLADLGKAQQYLAEARDLLGILGPGALAKFEQDYQRLVEAPEKNPALKSALERITAQGEVQKAPKAAETPKGEEPKKTEKPKLPKGITLSGIERKTWDLLTEASKDKPLAKKKVNQILFPRIPNKIRSNRTDTAIYRLSKKLLGSEIKIANATPRGSNKGAQWYLEGSEVQKEVKPKEPRGETVELPDGQKITVSKEQKILVEGLLACSRDHPCTKKELEKFVYKNKIPRYGIKNLLTRTTEKLEEVNWQVVNIISKGGVGHYYPESRGAEVPKPKKREEVGPKPQEILDLPDGQKFPIFKDSQKLAMELFLKSSKENPVSIVELAKLIYGDEKALTKVKDVVSRIRLKLHELGWTIENLTTTREQLKGVKSQYYLVKTSEVPKPEKAAKAEKPKKVKKEKAKKTSRVFETLELSTDRAITAGKMQIKLLRSLLGGSAQNPVSISELAKILYGEATEENENKAASVITSIRGKLAEVGFRIVNAYIEQKHIGQKGAYYLESTGEPVHKTETKKFDEIHEFTLPNDKKIAGKNAKILKALNGASLENPISAEELAQEIYPGAPYATAKLNLMPSLTNIRKQLVGSGLELVVVVDKTTRKASYYLRKIDQVQEPVKETQERAVFDAQAPQSSPVGVPSREVRVVPYSPTKEEMRTGEETRIIDKVVFCLTLREGRIMFEELNDQLKTDARIEIHGGKRYYRIYTAEDLIPAFLSGFDKLWQESEIAFLRDNWSENEKKLWERAKTLMRRMSGGDFHEFQGKVQKALEKAEKDFYRRFPPERGLKKSLIEIDK